MTVRINLFKVSKTSQRNQSICLPLTIATTPQPPQLKEKPNLNSNLLRRKMKMLTNPNFCLNWITITTILMITSRMAVQQVSQIEADLLMTRTHSLCLNHRLMSKKIALKSKTLMSKIILQIFKDSKKQSFKTRMKIKQLTF